ncbi:hypothetical protein [Christiangramia portivictoriae]|uniref:hypothetical protein n=1 Tax=Christiangramia portivictoriae TaxID=326069 RepID=UPI000429D6FD|nr:hypothetical protein [Christiangramia portivictoriae]
MEDVLIGEKVLLGVIFILQVIAVIDILISTSKLQSIFSKKISLDEESHLFLYKGTNNVKKTIIDTINNYISKNKGGVIDFHIIHDIVERNVETVDEEVSNKLPTPLYLGLAGTMIGIIIGLFYVDLTPVLTSSPQENSDLSGLSPLIDGVRYAMIVSVIGLAFTTFLSVIVYKLAKSKMNKGKNDFLSQVQTELLPTLIKSDDVAIQELSRELRVFSSKTPGVVSNLDQNIQLVKETIDKEIALLKQVRNLDVSKLSASNAEIFKSLSGMMDTFSAFPGYYKELNNSLGNTTELSNNLQSLVSSTQNVNYILGEMKDMITSSNEATKFFNEHIQSFEYYSEAVNVAIGETNKSFDRALDKLNQAVSAQIEAFGSAISKYDSSLSEAFNASIEKFNKTAENAIHKYNKGFETAIGQYSESFETAIKKYNETFDQSIESYNNTLKEISPNFQKLDHLEALQGISRTNKTLDVIEKAILNQSEILKNLNIQLPKNANIVLQKEKGVSYYMKQTAFYSACLTVTSVSIYIFIDLIWL